MKRRVWFVVVFVVLVVFTGISIIPGFTVEKKELPKTIIGKDGVEMVLIPAGEFLMGSTEKDADDAMAMCEETKAFNSEHQCDRENFYKDEMPQHKVYLDDYYIDKYEVTNAQFKKFAEETGYITDVEKSKTAFAWIWAGFYKITGVTKTDGSMNWRHPNGKFMRWSNVGEDRWKNLPVGQMSWNDANAYCKWAGKRLPTEAEWEKAARGTDARIFPWGNKYPDVGGKIRANYGKGANGMLDGYEYAAPVGSFSLGTSPYGVMDMAGNQWEWVADLYDENYYKNSPDKNPIGPNSGTLRIVKGGSWSKHPELLRTANKEHLDPKTHIFN